MRKWGVLTGSASDVYQPRRRWREVSWRWRSYSVDPNTRTRAAQCPARNLMPSFDHLSFFILGAIPAATYLPAPQLGIGGSRTNRVDPRTVPRFEPA